MDFSLQILKTGALFALTSGTIVGSIVAGNRIGAFISDRAYKLSVTSGDDIASQDPERTAPYEYKYIDEYKQRCDEMEKDCEDESCNDDESEEQSKQKTLELKERLNGIKIHEITPNGDVIMHYDTDLESFVYYCDDKNIPYKYLETVARKYCLDNQCLEIFVNMYDELKKGIMRQTQAKIEKCQNDAKKPEDRESDTNGVFASFKQYNKTNPKEMIKQRKYITKENANRYSYRGTISTGKDLRIEDPKKKADVVANQLLREEERENPPYREQLGSTDSASPSRHKKISFSDFKRMKNTTSVESLPVKTLEQWVESDNEDRTSKQMTHDSPTFSPIETTRDPAQDTTTTYEDEITVNETELSQILHN